MFQTHLLSSSHNGRSFKYWSTHLRAVLLLLLFLLLSLELEEEEDEEEEEEEEEDDEEYLGHGWGG